MDYTTIEKAKKEVSTISNTNKKAIEKSVVGTVPTKEEKEWAMFSHLSTFLLFSGIPLANIIGPIIMWQLKKEAMPFASFQAKESLNFQISMTIYSMTYLLLSLISIGLLFFLDFKVMIPVIIILGIIVLVALLVIHILLTIIAAVKANAGVGYKYPLIIRFIK